MTDHSPKLVSAEDIERYVFATRFLSLEAKLLDERRFDEWAEMLHDELDYEVPLRQAKMEFGDEFVRGAFRLKDTKDVIQIRLERLRSGYAWSETPPSRTLRTVGSVLVLASSEINEIVVESALLIYRQRGTTERGDLIPVRRTDAISIENGVGLLKRRRAIIADTVLQTPNLGIFI